MLEPELGQCLSKFPSRAPAKALHSFRLEFSVAETDFRWIGSVRTRLFSVHASLHPDARSEQCRSPFEVGAMLLRNLEETSLCTGELDIHVWSLPLIKSKRLPLLPSMNSARPISSFFLFVGEDGCYEESSSTNRLPAKRKKEISRILGQIQLKDLHIQTAYLQYLELHLP
ncbi:MAG: hypothetical protein SGCHY_003217 [Lobulomycetales sp.]